MKILFLDDQQIRHDAFRRNRIGHDVVHVYTSKEAISALDTASEPFDLAQLDHDLAEEHYLTASEGECETNWGARSDGVPAYSPGTGMDVVDHIVQMTPETRPKRVICHTFNARGEEMVARLRDAGVAAQWIKFDPRK